MKTKQGKRVCRTKDILILTQGNSFPFQVEPFQGLNDLPKPVFNIWDVMCEKYAIKEGPYKGVLDFRTDEEKGMKEEVYDKLKERVRDIEDWKAQQSLSEKKQIDSKLEGYREGIRFVLDLVKEQVEED